MMRVAAARYPIDRLDSFEAFAAKQRDWIVDAARSGASLVVLPEYLGCELAGWLSDNQIASPAVMFEALQPWRDTFVSLFRNLAREFGVAIQAGTFITAHHGRFRNRATFIAADGSVIEQDKLALTGFERDLTVLDPGDTPIVFALAETRAAIATCYDCEFPLPVRAQVEAGARIVIVPSCTDTEAGATRVQIGCRARAMENQVYVVQSVTAGDASWNPVLDVNTGTAAIYTPIDRGFPSDGVLATAKPGERYAIADLDIAALDRVRREGAVANDRDWAAQLRPSTTRAKLVR